MKDPWIIEIIKENRRIKQKGKQNRSLIFWAIVLGIAAVYFIESFK